MAAKVANGADGTKKKGKGKKTGEPGLLLFCLNL
jgi:hypothetical protein